MKFRIQDSLKKKLIVQDDFHWKLPVSETETAQKCGGILKYVGGVDLSFRKDDPSGTETACGTLVVLDIENLNVVYQDSSVVKIDVPYVPGFLAFREVLTNRLVRLYSLFIPSELFFFEFYAFLDMWLWGNLNWECVIF